MLLNNVNVSNFKSLMEHLTAVTRLLEICGVKTELVERK